MSTIDDLARQVLADVVADFGTKGLGASALNAEYVGVSMKTLETKYCTNELYNKVDFDLAMKQLEEGEFVKTGPMEPYENKPGSYVVILAIFSKREYAYLTEKGYKAAQKPTIKRGSSATNVHISGGNFHQSPIGIGASLNQTVNFNDQKTLDDLRRLVEVFEKHIDELGLEMTAKRKAMAQVATIKAQLEDEPDAGIVRQAGLTLRNITEGAIAGLVAAAVQPSVWSWVAAHIPNLFG